MFSIVNNPREKIMCLINLCCLAEQQNFITTGNFAKYGSL